MKWQEVSFMEMVEHAKDRIVYCGSMGRPKDLPADHSDMVIFSDQTKISVSSQWNPEETDIPRYWIFK